MHLHNMYEFDFLPVPGVAVVPEIIVAVLGNPWLVPPLPGQGLVQLDRITGNFRPLLVVSEQEDNDTTNHLNVRSAKQVAPGIFYAVTQEPAGEATQVVRLEQTTTPEAHKTPHGLLKIVARSVLPARDGGDGGADVVIVGTKQDAYIIMCIIRLLRLPHESVVMVPSTASRLTWRPKGSMHAIR